MLNIGACDPARWCASAPDITTTKAIITTTPSVTTPVTAPATTPPVTTLPVTTPTPTDNCSSVTVAGRIARHYELDCVYHRTNEIYNNYPVYVCQRPRKTYETVVYLRKDGYLAIHTLKEEGDGPVIWIKRTAETACPSDNTHLFGFYNWNTVSLDTAGTEDLFWGDSVPITEAPIASCAAVKVSGSVATFYQLDCTYRQSDRSYNNYPVFECDHDGNKIIYLRRDGYLALHSTLEEGNGPVIWLERTADTTCPFDNKGAFGYWDLEKSATATAGSSEVTWIRISTTTRTTTITTTTSTPKTTNKSFTTTTKTASTSTKPTTSAITPTTTKRKMHDKRIFVP